MTVGEFIKELQQYNPNEELQISLDASAEEYITVNKDLSTEHFEVESHYFKDIEPLDISYVDVKFYFYNG